MLLVDLDPTACAHLARALDAHTRWCRAQRIAVPAALVELERHLTADSGQHGHDVDSVPTWPDAAPVVMGYEETSRALKVSVRTVRRLVADGELRPVRIGRSVRFTREEVARFAERGDNPT